MSRNVIIGIVVVVVLIGGYFLLSPKSQPAAPQTPETATSTESAAPQATEGAMMGEQMAVTISASGFVPKAVTVKVGDSVTWENTDSANHTVNSDPHPTHTLYPFLNVGVVKAGEKKSVTFDKAGTYTYHDHLNPSLTGSVTVQ